MISRLVVVVVVGLSLSALAQDKTRAPVLESKVDAQVALVSRSADGGCQLQPQLTKASADALVADGETVNLTTRRVSESVCVAVLPVATKAAKVDVGVGPPSPKL